MTVRPYMQKEDYQIANDFIIRFRPMENKYFDVLEKEEQLELSNLLELAYKKPEQAIEPLNRLKEKYPDNPIIINYLYNSCIRLDKLSDAWKYAEENYKKNPEYLFARISYGYLWLNKKDLSKIKNIFKGKFSLKELYPERKVFHISELISLNDFLSRYFLALNQREYAMKLYQQSLEVSPEHRVTRVIGERLGIKQE